MTDDLIDYNQMVNGQSQKSSLLSVKDDCLVSSQRIDKHSPNMMISQNAFHSDLKSRLGVEESFKIDELGATDLVKDNLIQKDSQLKTDLLHVAIVDIYCNLKRFINKFTSAKMQGHGINVEENEAKMDSSFEIGEDEQRRLLKLGNLVLVDYVRSMIDLLVSNLEETHQSYSKL